MGDNDTQLSGLEASQKDEALIQLWQMIGAHKAVSRIAASLGAQSIRALEMVRDKKYYLAAKHETFDGFLDHHPGSPMSYEAFRRRSNLLNNEGDIAFDLLNSLSVPLSQRKLLAGQIEVTDNEIKIGGATTRLDDGPRIVELISKLHLKTQEQQRTIERGKKDVDKYKRQKDEAEKRAIVANPDGTATGQAVLTLAGAFKRLEEELESATDEEKLAMREPIFQLLSSKQLDLSVALGIVSREEIPSGDDLPESDDDETARLLEEL